MDITAWMTAYVQAVERRFGSRVWLIGLQGSRARGEAEEGSDIDVVLILDRVEVGDLLAYSQVLDTLPNRELICGFVSGREELFAWEKSELFQFCRDTVPIQGTLAPVLARVGRADILRAVHTGVCAVYHQCAHNLVHEKSAALLRESEKCAAFALRAIAYLRTGRYAARREELLGLLTGEDRQVLAAGMARGADLSPRQLAQRAGGLLTWAAHWMGRLAGCQGQEEMSEITLSCPGEICYTQDNPREEKEGGPTCG